jgi:hypothetical protein
MDAASTVGEERRVSIANGFNRHDGARYDRAQHRAHLIGRRLVSHACSEAERILVGLPLPTSEHR